MTEYRKAKDGKKWVIKIPTESTRIKIRKCMVCGNTFVTTTDKKKTCSPECYNIRKRVTKQRNCKRAPYYYYKKKLANNLVV